jgi:hypothetical protein
MANKYAVKQLIFERRKAFREANKKPFNMNKTKSILLIGYLLVFIALVSLILHLYEH